MARECRSPRARLDTPCHDRTVALFMPLPVARASPYTAAGALASAAFTALRQDYFKTMLPAPDVEMLRGDVTSIALLARRRAAMVPTRRLLLDFRLRC